MKKRVETAGRVVIEPKGEYIVATLTLSGELIKDDYAKPQEIARICITALGADLLLTEGENPLFKDFKKLANTAAQQITECTSETLAGHRDPNDLRNKIME